MSEASSSTESIATTHRLPTVEAASGSEGRARRFWSARRIPSALTALVVLGAAGLLLYDVAAVRAGRSAMAWRKSLADALSTLPLDSPWVLGGAAGAVVVGMWLIVLAVTPGLRAVLPMRRDTPGIRAGLDRHAAELALRDRAMEVSGVRFARVAVGWRTAKVHAEAHFREQEEVRGDLAAALGEGIRQLGLDRPPELDLRLSRMRKE
jgi:hypothetical protein